MHSPLVRPGVLPAYADLYRCRSRGRRRRERPRRAIAAWASPVHGISQAPQRRSSTPLSEASEPGCARAYDLGRTRPQPHLLHMKSLLIGVSSGDPLNFVTMAVLLAVADRLACYLPARRAISTNPIIALRYELGGGQAGPHGRRFPVPALGLGLRPWSPVQPRFTTSVSAAYLPA